jgi:hypothetical protein
MKTMIATFGFLAALPLAAAAQVTKEDIKKLVAAGVSEDVVLTYVRANGPAPKLSADDIVELKQAGAGEKVLAALAAGTTSAPAPAPRTEVVERVVEKPVYVPQTTYVYSTPSSSSYWCSSHYSYDGCHTYVRPIVTYGYYSSWYPRHYYGGYYGGYYRSSHCYPRSRVGISVGWRW